MKNILNKSAAELVKILGQIGNMESGLQQIGQAMLDCWKKGGKVLIAGNGGSACDGMHFAEELVVRYKKDRKALAAVSLTDAGAITCCGNDYSFEQIFQRQVEALGNAGDVLVAMSTSGNSVNLLRAIQTAKARKMITVAFLGKGGGKTKGLCDFELVVPSDSTARVQEIHKLFFHVLCEWIDQRID